MQDQISLMFEPLPLSFGFDFEEVLGVMKLFMNSFIYWIVKPCPPKLNSIIVFYFLYSVENEI